MGIRGPNAAQTKAEERAAWRNFLFSMLSLGVAFLLAVYSDVLAREGNVIAPPLPDRWRCCFPGSSAWSWVPKLRASNVDGVASYFGRLSSNSSGTGYLAAIFIVSIAALNTGNNMLFLILSAMIAAILVSGVVSRIVLTGLEVDIALPDRVFAGQPVLGRVRLTNHKPLLPTFSVLASGVQKSAVYFPFVRAGKTASQTIEITFSHLAYIKKTSSRWPLVFPFGFLEKVRRFPPRGRCGLSFDRAERGFL